MKEIFSQVFGSPKGHPKVKPFIDHVFSFFIADNRIWFRNYQVTLCLCQRRSQCPQLKIQDAPTVEIFFRSRSTQRALKSSRESTRSRCWWRSGRASCSTPFAYSSQFRLHFPCCKFAGSWGCDYFLVFALRFTVGHLLARLCGRTPTSCHPTT